jgi:hypothetical protein
MRRTQNVSVVIAQVLKGEGGGRALLRSAALSQGTSLRAPHKCGSLASARLLRQSHPLCAISPRKLRDGGRWS